MIVTSGSKDRVRSRTRSSKRRLNTLICADSDFDRMTSLRRGEPLSKSEGRSRRKRLIETSRILRPAPVFCPQPAPGSPVSGFEDGYRSDGGSGLFHHGAFLGYRKVDRTSPGLAPDGPDEAGQLSGHGGGDHRLLLSGFRQMAVPEGEAFLGLPGDGADLGRLSLVPHPDASALSGGKAVAPGGLSIGNVKYSPK